MKKLGAIILMLALFEGSSAGTLLTGHVKEMQVNKSLGNILFVQLDVSHNAPIACHSNLGWTYTIPMQSEADKRIFAMLLTARAIGATVTLFGSGSCSDFSAVESIAGADIQ